MTYSFNHHSSLEVARPVKLFTARSLIEVCVFLKKFGEINYEEEVVTINGGRMLLAFSEQQEGY